MIRLMRHTVEIQPGMLPLVSSWPFAFIHSMALLIYDICVKVLLGSKLSYRLFA